MKNKTIKFAFLFTLLAFVAIMPVASFCLEKTPKIKVGLYNTDDWVEVTANYNYRIRSNKTTLKTVKRNKITKIKYNKNKSKYIVKQGKDKFEVDNFVRIVPKIKNRLVTITNYENRPAWNTELNDNVFKGKLEIHYAEDTDKTWVINILGLENYIKGIGEAGNNNDPAYLKALLTAARTYAYWHYTYPTKHADEPYLLDTTGNDQVYIGWGFTKRAPNVEQAVIDTKGMIVKYDDEVAVTPYYSKSDGRTRSWSEVWAGDYEYLVTKDDPGCDGETLTGHGVGMSALGARYFAEDKDWGWKKILKYYYTGIDIEAIY